MVTMNGVGGLTGGDVLVGDVRQPEWWLVDGPDDGSGRIVAGPFGDRTDAAWAAAGQGPDEVRAEYGFRRADGGLSRCASPEDRAWFTRLEEQLDLLPEEWDDGLADDDPLVTLTIEVVASLVEAGLPLHDVRDETGTGGVGVVPEPALDGVVVTWRTHGHPYRHHEGGGLITRMQQVMLHAVVDVLTLQGFDVTSFGTANGIVVRYGA
jgi:hypothetical protein